MIQITDANLTTVGDTPFAGVFLVMQAELEVAVYSGTNAVVVSWGDRLASFAGPPPGSASGSLDPIELSLPLGVNFEGVVSDLHLSTLFASWTQDHGGALRMRAVFEEEGTELRGGVADIDLDHMELDVYFVPALDDTDTVVWTLELDFEVAGGLTGLVRGQLESEFLTGELTRLIAEPLELLLPELNGLFELPENGITSIDVDDGMASFDNLPAGQQRVDIVLDAVEIHDDSDGIGQGELTFSATVGGVDTGPSAEVPAGSGSIVPLEGSIWRTSLTLSPQASSVSLLFEVRDADGGQSESLGVINVDLDPGDAPVALRLRPASGDYTLLMRIVPRGAIERAPRTRHLRVDVASAEIRRDLDTSGRGEVQFWGLVADQPTLVSAETKVHGSDDPEIDLAATDGSPLRVELFIPEGEDLEVRVIGWDNDPSQRDWLGEARLVMPGAAIGVATGPEQVVSDSGDFIASIVIVDLDAPGSGEGPIVEQPETVARLVVFDALTLERDGELGAGEILASATANGQGLGGGEPIDTSAGTELALVGSAWRRQIDVPVDGTLDLTVRVVDVDGRVDDADQHNDELLGTAAASFSSADDDFGLGSHVLGDADGDFSFRLRILDPATEVGDVAAMVRFESVDILHDHTTIGRGAFWCSGSVNGVPVGTAERFEAGNGDAIVLDGSAWSHTVGLDAGEEIAISFEVVEADDNDHVSLGTASARLTPPLSAGSREVTSDEGDYVLHFSVLDPGRTANNRLRVTFLEITVLDDADGISEGELRYLATANERQSGLSVLQKVRSGEPVQLVGDMWTLEPQLDAGDELEISFTVYDADADALELHDRVEQSYTFAQSWGLGEHVATSSDERFRVRYVIAGADDEALPDLPDRIPLLVEFTAVEVFDDGDGGANGRGEISFTGELNDVTVLQTGEFEVRSGETVLLGETLPTRTVWLAPDEDLEVELVTSERDGGRFDVLGTSRRVHSAASGWDLGVHEVPAPGGAVSATWRVDRADGPRVRVKFMHVHVFEDKDPVGRGKLVCEGAVNGVSTGPSLPMRAGSDGASAGDDLESDLFLGGPRWRKTLSYDPDDVQAEVTFTVTELDALSADDLLGTVRFDAADVIADTFGIGLQKIMADTERFELTFLVARL